MSGRNCKQRNATRMHINEPICRIQVCKFVYASGSPVWNVQDHNYNWRAHVYDTVMLLEERNNAKNSRLIEEYWRKVLSRRVIIIISAW